jgi:predicted protein tyrosine phosphatase
MVEKLLFVCTENRNRSPSAARLFSGKAHTQSAGTGFYAEVTVTPELLEWADVVVCMEEHHRDSLRRRFKSAMRGRRCVVLDVPDVYDPDEPALLDLLREKMPAFT